LSSHLNSGENYETLTSVHLHWIIGGYHGFGAKSASAVGAEQQRGQ
jgi:hypothetical protein